MRSAGLVGLAAVLCLATGCGNRRSLADVKAAADGSGGQLVQVGSNGAAGSGGGVTVPGAVGTTAPSVTRGGSGGTTGGSGSVTGSGTGPRVAGGSTTGSATGGAVAGPANLSPVNVGIVGTFSGAVGTLVSGSVTGAQLWAKYINAHGGVSGHPVNVLVGDDQGDPARFNSLVQQFATQDKVIAFIETTIGFAPNGDNSYLDNAKIPTFSSEGGLDKPYQDFWTLTSLPTGHSYAKTILFGDSEVFRKAGHTKLAVYTCSDFSLCNNFADVLTDPALLKKTGMTLVAQGKPSITQPDYTSACLDAKQKGANAIVLILDGASLQRFADDCARQNYHPTFGTADLVITNDLPKDPNLDGTAVATKMTPWLATAVKGIATYRQALQDYAPGRLPDGATAIGWEQASFFGAAASHLPANPTPADVVKGIAALRGEDLDGLTYPLSFSVGRGSPNKVCYGIVWMKAQKYQLFPSRKPLQCL